VLGGLVAGGLVAGGLVAGGLVAGGLVAGGLVAGGALDDALHGLLPLQRAKAVGILSVENKAATATVKIRFPRLAAMS